MRKTLALLFSLSPAICFAADAPAPAAKPDAKAAAAAPVTVPVWTLAKDKSFIKFVAIENGAPVEGKFTDFSTDVHFDPNHLDVSTISGEVKTGSIVSDNNDAQSNLKTPDWLSVDAFPTATFKSGKLSRMPQSNNYYTEGTLTLRGKTLPVVMNFQLKEYGDTDIAEGYMTIKRNAFGVGQGQWAKDDTVADDVRVEFRIAEQKQ